MSKHRHSPGRKQSLSVRFDTDIRTLNQLLYFIVINIPSRFFECVRRIQKKRTLSLVLILEKVTLPTPLQFDFVILTNNGKDSSQSNFYCETNTKSCTRHPDNPRNVNKLMTTLFTLREEILELSREHFVFLI